MPIWFIVSMWRYITREPDGRSLAGWSEWIPAEELTEKDPATWLLDRRRSPISVFTGNRTREEEYRVTFAHQIEQTPELAAVLEVNMGEVYPLETTDAP